MRRIDRARTQCRSAVEQQRTATLPGEVRGGRAARTATHRRSSSRNKSRRRAVTQWRHCPSSRPVRYTARSFSRTSCPILSESTFAERTRAKRTDIKAEDTCVPGDVRRTPTGRGSMPTKGSTSWNEFSFLTTYTPTKALSPWRNARSFGSVANCQVVAATAGQMTVRSAPESCRYSAVEARTAS